MIPIIRENTLIQWHDDSEKPTVERVLYIDPSGVNLVLFNINTKNALPLWRTFADIANSLANSQAHVLTIDPYESLICEESDISEEARKRRDAAWHAIQDLVLDEEQNIHVAFFGAEYRGKLLASKEKGHGARTNSDETQHHRKVLYEWCRKWWRGGMRKNALLPRWDRCGSNIDVIGRPRTIQNKLGRPSKESVAQGVAVGVIIDAHAADLILKGYRRFFDKKLRYPYQYAYLQTMGLYFNDGHEQKPDGQIVPILKLPTQRPTIRQFKSCIEKACDTDYVNELKRTLGPGTFNLKHRALPGNSTQEAFGPMSVFQIDPWLADIYLVSALNRKWIIGRPVLYSIKDVFSRLIVGFSVSLEGPSWTGAVLALQNVVEDKVAFCASYGITIVPEMWPTGKLPRVVLADRAEFEGYNASTLENGFSVRVSNTPPYRGDLKAIVERDFLLIKDRTVQLLPGHVYKLRERGEKDYRLEACLTLDEFRQIIIRHIIYHNNCWRMKWYRLDEFAIQDDIEPYPIRLWNWGIENRIGAMREQPSVERVRLGLLPRRKAVSTPSGLLFENLHYQIEFPGDEWGHMAEEVYVRARMNGRQEFTIAYDERNIKTIYLSVDAGQKLVPCHLSPSETSFHGRDIDLYDARYYFELQKYRVNQAQAADEQALLELQLANQETAKQARALTDAARGDQSNSSRLANIRENRQLEREVERNRSTSGGTLGENPSISAATTPNELGKSAYVPPPQPYDLLEELL